MYTAIPNAISGVMFNTTQQRRSKVFISRIGSGVGAEGKDEATLCGKSPRVAFEGGGRGAWPESAGDAPGSGSYPVHPGSPEHDTLLASPGTGASIQGGGGAGDHP